MSWNLQANRAKTLREFQAFSAALLKARDIDPDYDLLLTIANEQSLSQEQRLWLSCLFAVTDNAPYAYLFFRLSPKYPPDFSVLIGYHRETREKLYFGKERQKHARNFLDTLRSYIDVMGKHQGTTLQLFAKRAASPKERFDALWGALKRVKYFGILTRHEFLEIAMRITPLDIVPTAMPTLTTGLMPLRGIATVCGVSKEDKSVDWFHEQAKRLSSLVNMDLMYTESCLCKYQKFREGRYYVGWEIDEQLAELAHLQHIHGSKRLASVLYKARKATFDPFFLKERLYGDDPKMLLSWKRFNMAHMTLQRLLERKYKMRFGVRYYEYKTGRRL